MFGLMSLGIGGFAVGCTSATAVAQKSGSGELRSDLLPLTTRFPALARASGATWMSGTMGDRAVPGPSTYWIDAIVTLPADQTAQYGQTYNLSAGEPTVFGPLQSLLPDGPLVGSADLNVDFGAAVLVATASSMVILSWIGE